MLVDLTPDEKSRMVEGYDHIHAILRRLLLFEGEFARDKEHLWVIGFKTLDFIQYIELAALGQHNKVASVPREVYRMAVHQGCTRIILAHNHPSGTLKFSAADGKFTSRMADGGELLGIELVDHLVISLEGWRSYYTHSKWGKPYGAKGGPVD